MIRNRYLITFSCYGTHLHGSESGSVDRNHNVFGSRIIGAHGDTAAAEHEFMHQASYEIGASERNEVLQAVKEVCGYRSWLLLAAHVRTTHVHAVLEADVKPEQVMTAFKSYATRRLNQGKNASGSQKRWSRRGSTRWLFTDEAVRKAVR
ncbi:MAG: hypothetical protein JWN34_1747 [Bryobacterales bacterium]|nr:hypothetical protein [Bryobacterales bacterium]